MIKGTGTYRGYTFLGITVEQVNKTFRQNHPSALVRMFYHLVREQSRKGATLTKLNHLNLYLLSTIRMIIAWLKITDEIFLRRSMKKNNNGAVLNAETNGKYR